MLLGGSTSQSLARKLLQIVENAAALKPVIARSTRVCLAYSLDKAPESFLARKSPARSHKGYGNFGTRLQTIHWSMNRFNRISKSIYDSGSYPRSGIGRIEIGSSSLISRQTEGFVSD